MDNWYLVTLLLIVSFSLVSGLAYREKHKREGLQELLSRILKGGNHGDGTKSF